MLVREFDFDLPPELIAQEPSRERGGARLLHLSRHDGRVEHARVSDLPQFGGYVTDGVTGLTFPREAPDADVQLAARLAGVLDDSALAARLRAAGVARARELSVDRIADAHLADFERLVAARGRPTS